MRENRTHGSVGGVPGQPGIPTPINIATPKTDSSGNDCGAGFQPAPGVWHFSAVVKAGRIHDEVLIDDILESRLEGPVAFL